MTERAEADRIQVLRPCPALFEFNCMMLRTTDKRVQEVIRNQRAVMDENRAMARRMQTPHLPLHEILPDGAWSGEPCFVVAGGPSLRGFDFERLRGRGRVIAINRAFEFIPWADMLFFMDHTFYQFVHKDPERLAKWESFRGYRVFLNMMGRLVPDCNSVKAIGRSGVSHSHSKGLYHGNNSGFGALQMALALGCRPIYLLGYDMLDEGKANKTDAQTHWHSGYGRLAHMGAPLSFRRDFDLEANRLKKLDYVFNLNPRSGLRVFKFKTIEEVLNGPARESVGNDTMPSAVPDVLGSFAQD